MHGFVGGLNSPHVLAYLGAHAPPVGFVEPCLPTPAHKPPVGPQWFHEIKHDGYRLIVSRCAGRVRLFTRRAYDWTDRYPLIVTGAKALPGSTGSWWSAMALPPHSKRYADAAAWAALDQPLGMVGVFYFLEGKESGVV